MIWSCLLFDTMNWIYMLEWKTRCEKCIIEGDKYEFYGGGNGKRLAFCNR